MIQPQLVTKVPIGTLVTQTIDKSGPSSGEQFTYIDIGGIDRNLKCIIDTKALRADEAPSRARQRVRARDVLVSTTRPNLNAVAIVPPALDGAIASTGFQVLRPTEELDDRYLHYFAQTRQFVEPLARIATGSVYPAVKGSDVLAQSIPLIPRREQERQADYLDTQFSRLADAEASLRRAKENLERYRRSVLHAACTGRLVPTETELAKVEGRDYEPASVLLERILKERRKNWEESQVKNARAKGKTLKGDAWKKRYKEPVAPNVEGLPKLPKGWCWASFAQLTVQIADVDHKMPKKLPDGVPYVSPKDFTGFHDIDFDGATKISITDFERLARKVFVEPGDLIYPRYGTIGKTRIVRERSPFIASYSCATIKTNPAWALPEFLYHFSRSLICNLQAQAAATETTQKNVGLKSIQGFAVPLPPMAEQARIVSAVARLESMIDQHLEQMARADWKAAQVRQSLLQSVFGSPNHA